MNEIMAYIHNLELEGSYPIGDARAMISWIDDYSNSVIHIYESPFLLMRCDGWSVVCNMEIGAAKDFDLLHEFLEVVELISRNEFVHLYDLSVGDDYTLMMKAEGEPTVEICDPFQLEIGDQREGAD